MLTFEAYDDLLACIYAGPTDGAALNRALCRLQLHLEAESAGVSLYDRDGFRLTHSINSMPRRQSRTEDHELKDLLLDPVCRLITRRRLDQARRVSDIIPKGRLIHSAYFHKLKSVGDFGFGMFVDLNFGDGRARLFAMKGAEDNDFGGEDVSLFGRVAKHFKRAVQCCSDLRRLAGEPPGSVVMSLENAFETSSSNLDISEEVLASIRAVLTAGEARVACKVASGISRAAAAEGLGISRNTLNTHLTRVYAKLGVSRSSELVLAINEIRSRAYVSRRR